MEYVQCGLNWVQRLALSGSAGTQEGPASCADGQEISVALHAAAASQARPDCEYLVPRSSQVRDTETACKTTRQWVGRAGRELSHPSNPDGLCESPVGVVEGGKRKQLRN